MAQRRLRCTTVRRMQPSLALVLIPALTFTVAQQLNEFSGGGSPVTFMVNSSAFGPGAALPKKFSCEGADASPTLEWSGSPAKTVSFALIADDPDAPAGTWVHWVLWNLPADARSLAEGVPRLEQLDDGARQGRNDFSKIGYNGPCPPPGKTHRYFFRLYALDAKLDLAPGATRQELDAAMQGHILAKAEYMGTFRR
jgi:Raf kinase inhibitor-like YbhB/YbcL family protein